MTNEDKEQFTLKLVLSWEPTEKELEVQSFTVPSELLERTDMNHIGKLLCIVGVDCCDGKIKLWEDS